MISLSECVIAGTANSRKDRGNEIHGIKCLATKALYLSYQLRKRNIFVYERKRFIRDIICEKLERMCEIYYEKYYLRGITRDPYAIDIIRDFKYERY